MKAMTFLKNTVIVALCICMALNLSSCTLSNSAQSDREIPTRDEIAEYIENTFPEKTYTLADSPLEKDVSDMSTLGREWAFSLDDYPGYTFHAYSRLVLGSIAFETPYPYVSNDAYSTVVQKVLDEEAFYNGVLQKEYPELCDLWDQKHVEELFHYHPEGFAQGFTLEEGATLTFDITIPDITRVDDAQKLAGIIVNYMQEKAPELSAIPFRIKVPAGETDLIYTSMDKGCLDYTASRDNVSFQISFAGSDWESVYNPDDDWGYYGSKAWKQELRNGICAVSAFNGVNVCGITDDEVQEWMQRTAEDGDDSHGKSINALVNKCIKLDDRYMLVGVRYNTEYGYDKGIYMSLGAARDFFAWCGLEVEGNRTDYKVTGVDGSIYEFSYSYVGDYDYFYYTKDGERCEWPKTFTTNNRRENCALDDGTIKQVSGVNLYMMLEPNDTPRQTPEPQIEASVCKYEINQKSTIEDETHN